MELGDQPAQWDQAAPLAPISFGEVRGYESALHSNKRALRELMRRRGLDKETLEEASIGWDAGANAYTIPIFDAAGSVVNIRRYQLDPPEERRKIWSVKGYGSPDLYPIDQLENDTIIVCEGEWDALATIQAGFPAITRTGAAKVWRNQWNTLFAGKTVYVCHDMDHPGQQGNRIVTLALADHAAQVIPVLLPYPVTAKHGKDLSDYWLEHDPEEFQELLDQSQPAKSKDATLPPARMVSIDQSMADDLIGKRVRLRVTVDGKSRDNYLAPKRVIMECGQNFGQKCAICPLNETEGRHELELSRRDSRLLKIVGSNEDIVLKELQTMVGIPTACKQVSLFPAETYSIAEYSVRPDIDQWTEERSTHQGRSVIVVNNGLGATIVNSTVELEGSLYPHPRDQRNTLLVDHVERVETSIDNFTMDDATYLRLEKFQAKPGQSPLAKMLEIADDLSNNVTRIYQRLDMHVFMDLVFHSVLAWQFNSDIERRGWLDALVLGDSRTGKSEAAEKLHRHYKVGHMTTGENTTFAGLVGGVKQVFGNKWEISWGTIPLNDRRMLILDEVSSLQEDEIGRMSSIRSSGEAIIDKIEGGSTLARTRLLWLSNPREGHQVGYYHHAFEAVNKLIGQREDVARFDMVMSVSNDEVSSEAINVQNTPTAPLYDSQSCHDLLGWVWSRTKDQVVWEPGVEEYIVRTLAIKMGQRYSEEPTPLVQSANVRVKIARIAVAMAARTFSHHPDDDEIIYVTKEHARDAARFLDRIYSNPSFGYLAASSDVLRRTKRARTFEDKMHKALEDDDFLIEYFKTRLATFDSNHFMETTGMTKDLANTQLNTWMRWGMLERTQNAWRVSNQFRKMLREY